MQYRIQLAAGNAGGFALYGSVSSPLVNMTESAPPGAPLRVVVMPLTGGLAQLAFTMPELSGGLAAAQARVCVSASSQGTGGGSGTGDDTGLNITVRSWPASERSPPMGPCDAVLTFGRTLEAVEQERDQDPFMAPSQLLSDAPIVFKPKFLDRFEVGQDLRATLLLGGLNAEQTYLARVTLASSAGAGTASEWSAAF